MRRNDLPHQNLEFHDRVGNVKDGQKPCVVMPVKREIRLHARDCRIPALSAVGVYNSRTAQTRYYSCLGKQADLYLVRGPLSDQAKGRKITQESHQRHDIPIQFPYNARLHGGIDGHCRRVKLWRRSILVRASLLLRIGWGSNFNPILRRRVCVGWEAHI